MSDEKVTRLDDAKAFREMGMPLNTEVIDGGDMPAPVAKAMEAGFKASIKFKNCIYAHVENPNRSTFDKLQRAFHRFMKATEPPTGDDFNSRFIAGILESEFSSVRAQWTEIWDALCERGERGEAFKISTEGLWPWEPTEATKRRQRHPTL